MARILIVGCGCRGTELARALQQDGYAVRGTTRDAGRLPLLEAAGIEGMVADPARLATLMAPIDGAGLVCWLMGTASGDEEQVAALHGTRLDSLLEMLVDTHVRGLVYEAAGTAPAAAFAEGARIAARAADTYRMPVEVVRADPADPSRWLGAMGHAVAAALAA